MIGVELGCIIVEDEQKVNAFLTNSSTKPEAASGTLFELWKIDKGYVGAGCALPAR